MRKVLLPSELIEVSTPEELARYVVEFERGSVWKDPRSGKIFFCPSPHGVRFEGLEKLMSFTSLEELVDDVDQLFINWEADIGLPINEYFEKAFMEKEKGNWGKGQRLYLKGEVFEKLVETFFPLF